MAAVPDDLTDPDQNVVLTGFMGTGKTTTGRRLARRLGFDFVDTDEVIVDRHGDIAELFATHGEARFRAIERDVAAEVAARRRHVVATGGRLMVDRDNELTLGASGRVVCLWATPDQILDRIRHSRAGVRRPLLEVDDPLAEIRSLLAERAPAYGRFPRLITGGLSPADTATEVETVISTPPRAVAGPAGTLVVGLGIAARARRCTDVDAVVDVGRIQPDHGLTATQLVGLQHHLVHVLGHATAVAPTGTTNRSPG